ncbi:MAG TPA: zinc ribbon domain-containing protein [Nitrososphaerales archaeon]|nr:zinc ribbon domain-containing protein [Nitrososphaerales archaeon]
MPLFGGGSKKVKFDARNPPQRFLENPQGYSFVHNFKVHYKRGVLQPLANKMDVSINSPSPELPTPQLVTNEFNQRMIMSVAHTDTKQRFDSASYHITNIEYKESFALVFSYGSSRPVAIPIRQPPNQFDNNFVFCKNCGNKLSSDSKFCNKCGTSVA